MRLRKNFWTAKVVFSFIEIPDDGIATREKMDLLTRGFLCVYVKLRQFKFPVRMLGIGVQVQQEFRSVVLRHCLTGCVLKKLIAQATPEANDDHLRVLFIIIALKISGMGLKQKIKNIPTIYNAILLVLNSINYFDWRFHQAFPKYKLTTHWQERIAIVKQSSDNQKLTYVPDAGKIFKDHQLLHNGLKITLGSYYDYGNTHLLKENRGVHEPQEEHAFAEILPFIRAHGTMMELGSYWAFYSMWFATKVSNAKCVMIEPDPHKMNFGKLNFTLNHLSGIFDLGFIADQTNLKPSISSYSVDYLMMKHGIKHLNILHSDIQGFELKMLEGSIAAMQNQKIDFFFISTHSNKLHAACIELLKSYEYQILCEANLDESFSVDGLIVAKRKDAAGPKQIVISRREK